LNDVIEEQMEDKSPYQDGNEVFEETQNNYTKILD